MHIFRYRRHETNLADDDVRTCSGRTAESKWVLCRAVRLSALLSYSGVSEVKQLWVRVSAKGSFNLAAFALPRPGPNHFFNTIIFLRCHFWPGAVCAGTDTVDFTASLGYFQVFKTQNQFQWVFFFVFDCVICFLFWSSMVPTHKCGAQRKKLMNLSFPLKGGSWASSVCTLSGPAAVSEFHTVTRGQSFTDGAQRVSCSLSVWLYLLAHFLQITFVRQLKPPRVTVVYHLRLNSHLCVVWISTMWRLHSSTLLWVTDRHRSANFFFRRTGRKSQTIKGCYTQMQQNEAAWKASLNIWTLQTLRLVCWLHFKPQSQCEQVHFRKIDSDSINLPNRKKDASWWWLCDLRVSRPHDKPLSNITYKNIETFQTVNDKKTEKAHKSLFCFTLN